VSSVTLILRLASITSRFTLIAIIAPYTVKSFSDFMSTAFWRSLSKIAKPVAMTIEANVAKIPKKLSEK
jgi:hypothetical protein